MVVTHKLAAFVVVSVICLWQCHMYMQYATCNIYFRGLLMQIAYCPLRCRWQLKSQVLYIAYPVVLLLMANDSIIVEIAMATY